MKTCSIENCQFACKYVTRGYCPTHYKRLLVHGDALVENRFKHGLSYTTEYKILKGMRERCFKEYCKEYPKYGGRGIKICDRWLGDSGVMNFIKDMGKRPSADYSIDRIDNNGDYTPENCRWATRSEQNKNRRPFRRGYFGPRGKRPVKV